MTSTTKKGCLGRRSWPTAVVDGDPYTKSAPRVVVELWGHDGSVSNRVFFGPTLCFEGATWLSSPMKLFIILGDGSLVSAFLYKKRLLYILE
jgi:hypothetical protein